MTHLLFVPKILKLLKLDGIQLEFIIRKKLTVECKFGDHEAVLKFFSQNNNIEFH